MGRAWEKTGKMTFSQRVQVSRLLSVRASSPKLLLRSGKKKSLWRSVYLTLFDMGFFEPSVIGGMRAPHHNFAVIAPMIIKFGTGVKLDVFYTMITKEFVTSLLLHHYDVITCISANA